MLPTFFIIGALKAGTTSLFEYLGQHPQVYTSPVKEPRHFLYADADPERLALAEDFADPPVVSRARYEALFDRAAQCRARGEASASYLYDVQAADRIRAAVPDAKLIALLRDPVERAYSSYLHLRRAGAEPHDTFAAALRAEPGRVEQGWPAMYHYVRSSRYAEHLQAYAVRFPREQILVLFYDDLVANPRALSRTTFAFLGVDEDFEPDVSAVYNRGGLARSSYLDRLLNHPPPAVRRLARLVVPAARRRGVYLRLHETNLAKAPPLEAGVAARLRAELAEDIVALERLTGRSLVHWRAASRSGDNP